MKHYSEKIKATMIKKLLSNPDLSATSLAKDSGIPQQTLSRWIRESGIIGHEGEIMKEKRPQDRTAQEKFKAVIDYSKLTVAEQGAYLRSHGLFSAHIESWKKEMLSSLENTQSGKRKKDAKDIKINELEKELRIKDKALAETAALLILKKKAQAIWGEVEEI